MKREYVAKVEIEFKTDDDPLEHLHRVMGRAGDYTNFPRYYIDHYHILEQPRELK